MIYYRKIKNIKENIEWLETSLVYFDSRLAKKILSSEDKKEIKVIVDMIRKDLTAIVNDVNGIAVIKSDN